MKYIPILFSTLMVQALLAGRKTMTRRIVKPQPENNDLKIELSEGAWGFVQKKQIGFKPDKFEIIQNWKCPYGKVGDVLWVREAASLVIFPKCDEKGKQNGENPIWMYRADQHDNIFVEKWKPSLFMPKEACRLFLEITNIRVERLQDINEEDAIAEGVEQTFDTQFELNKPSFINYFIPQKKRKHKIVSGVFRYAKDSYETLWQSINGANSWNNNPWVWVIEFKQIEKPNNFN